VRGVSGESGESGENGERDDRGEKGEGGERGERVERSERGERSTFTLLLLSPTCASWTTSSALRPTGTPALYATRISAQASVQANHLQMHNLRTRVRPPQAQKAATRASEPPALHVGFTTASILSIGSESGRSDRPPAARWIRILSSQAVATTTQNNRP